MSLIRLLDAAKAVTGSDNATAAAIGCGRALLSDVRAGRKPMAAHLAAKLAELVGHDWQNGALAALEAQARTEDERNYWARIIKQTGRALTVLVVAVVMGFSTPKTAYAFEHMDSTDNIHYGQLKRRFSGWDDQRLWPRFSGVWRFLLLVRETLRGCVSGLRPTGFALRARPQAA